MSGAKISPRERPCDRRHILSTTVLVDDVAAADDDDDDDDVAADALASRYWDTAAGNYRESNKVVLWGTHDSHVPTAPAVQFVPTSLDLE